jgi:hypothetical protein
VDDRWGQRLLVWVRPDWLRYLVLDTVAKEFEVGFDGYWQQLPLAVYDLWSSFNLLALFSFAFCGRLLGHGFSGLRLFALRSVFAEITGLRLLELLHDEFAEEHLKVFSECLISRELFLR